MTLPSPGLVADTITQQCLEAIRKIFPLTSQYLATDSITATQIAAGAVGDSEIADAYISASTYTPTLFNTTNVAASTAAVTAYLRIGSTVVLGGVVQIDPTAATVATILGMSLPVASNFGASTDAGGAANSQTGATPWTVYADAANDRLTFDSQSVASAANQNVAFSVVYRVI